jgi:hypothetical protein
MKKTTTFQKVMLVILFVGVLFLAINVVNAFTGHNNSTVTVLGYGFGGCGVVLALVDLALHKKK